MNLNLVLEVFISYTYALYEFQFYGLLQETNNV